MTTATHPETTAAEPDTTVPVLIGLTEMVKLVDQQPQTVYRWRIPRHGKPPILPEPLAIISRTPIWKLDDFLEFAESKGIRVDTKVLREIRKAQGR